MILSVNLFFTFTEFINHEKISSSHLNSTADAHIAAIATQNQNQTNQTSQQSSSSSTAAVASTTTTQNTESQSNDPDLSMDQDESLPEPPEIMPKGMSLNCFIFAFINICLNLPNKALLSWREAVARSHTSAQLSMALYVLESCVAWDKSIMKAVSVCRLKVVFILLLQYQTKL